MDFHFVRLLCTLTISGRVRDPYALFGVRTQLAGYFREVIGCRHESCPPGCPYGQLFGQLLSSDPVAVRRHQKPPLPFAFDLPVLPSSAARGTNITAGVVLAGHAIQQLDPFILSLSRLWGEEGRGGGVRLVAVSCLDHGGGALPLPLGGGGTPTLLSAGELCRDPRPTGGTIALRFLTPLRLMEEGRPARTISFSLLVRSLMRRSSAIAYYYGGCESDLDYRWLAERSREVATVADETAWAEWQRNLGGLVGRAVFTGPVDDFLPFLLFGELFHAGKGAAYGMGGFRLEMDRRGLS